MTQPSDIDTLIDGLSWEALQGALDPDGDPGHSEAAIEAGLVERVWTREHRNMNATLPPQLRRTETGDAVLARLRDLAGEMDQKELCWLRATSFGLEWGDEDGALDLERRGLLCDAGVWFGGFRFSPTPRGRAVAALLTEVE